MKSFPRFRASFATATFLSPNAKAAITIFSLSAITAELFGLYLSFSEEHSYRGLAPMTLFMALPCVISAIAVLIARKHTAIFWGPLTAVALASWSAALSVRENGWNSEALIVFVGVLGFTGALAVLGAFTAQRWHREATAE